MISANSDGSMLPPDSTASDGLAPEVNLAGEDGGQRNRAARFDDELQLAKA